jgi:hypothetical protein
MLIVPHNSTITPNVKLPFLNRPRLVNELKLFPALRRLERCRGARVYDLLSLSAITMAIGTTREGGDREPRLVGEKKSVTEAPQREVNVSRSFGVGALAAFCEAVVLQPTLYAKNARAQGLPMSFSPRVLYRGSTINILNEQCCMGVQFTTTAILTSILGKHGGELGGQETHEIASAIGGGALSATLASPLELLMIQQQKEGGSVFATMKRTVSATRGPSILFRGFPITVARDSIYVGSMLGLTPTLQRKLENLGVGASTASFYASIVGGVVAAVPSHPFDVVKTCLQGDLHQHKYPTVSATFKSLMREGGAKRFFNGGIWRTINIVGTVYIVNEVQNFVHRFESRNDY